jgi:hypothetical protein
MSVSTEVQRTLVKSPPELWAELGSQEGLARHLGEIGEIRVTKVEPESRVEWEADQASGVVQLKQSGWGTRVTLSLTRELPEAEGDAEATPENAAEPEAAAKPEAEAEHVAAEPEVADESVVLEPRPETAPADEPTAEQEAIAQAPEPVAPALASEPEPEPAVVPAPRQGLFARLFKRRRPIPVVTEPEPAVQPQAMALPEPIYPDPPPRPVEPEPSADLAAELVQLEAQLQQESTELLTGVLDRLGAAHHRPFSRG